MSDDLPPRGRCQVENQIIWDVVVSPLFEENAYIVRLAQRRECFIVDPGFDAHEIISFLHRRQLLPEAILVTHGHVDHIAGVGQLKMCWPDVPVFVGLGDAAKLADPYANLSATFGFPIQSPPGDRLLVDGERFSVAGISILAREVPGHSRGHMVFICEERSPAAVFVGDVIFAGSVGRTDFEDGDFRQLVESIERVLWPMPDDTVLLPGHGPPTTVGRERRTNPYLSGSRIW